MQFMQTTEHENLLEVRGRGGVAVCQSDVWPSQAWRHAKRGRPKMSAKLLRVLGLQRPDLAEVTNRSNSCIQRRK